MSKKAHTPGPWVWNGKHGSLHRAGEKPYQFGESILRPTWEYDEGSDLEVSEANAHLIAAAPDLLEALKAVIADITYETPSGNENCRFCDCNMDHEGTFRNMHDPDCVSHSIRAALSKATGGAS